MSKGSKRRPADVDDALFSQNWARTFMVAPRRSDRFEVVFNRPACISPEPNDDTISISSAEAMTTTG
jgi:hypothetical protein